VPLVATQLLFVNLLTDAFPAFALGMEAKEAGIMNRKPRNPKEAIINRKLMNSVITRALFVAAGALAAFLYGLFVAGAGREDAHLLAMSMCFFTLVAGELLVVYPSKSDAFSGFGTLFNNRFLNISMLLSLLILIAVMYIPVLSDLFTVMPLTIDQLIICVLLILFTVGGFEISKINSRK
jgi:Ca2+-transporting ATPase